MSWATCPLARTILVYVSKHRFNSKYSDVLALRSTNIAFGLCIELGPLPLLKKKHRFVPNLKNTEGVDSLQKCQKIPKISIRHLMISLERRHKRRFPVPTDTNAS